MKFFYRFIVFICFGFLIEPYFFKSIGPTTAYGANKHLDNGKASAKIILSVGKSPQAEKKPITTILHSDTRIDNYSWMRDSAWPTAVKNKDILHYIHQENAYAKAVLKPLKLFEEKLYQEMKGRIAEKDSSYPVNDGDYLYYTRFEKGKDFALHCRKKVGSDKEEIILDENKLAKGHKNFSLGSLRVSPDHTLLAYAVDTSGSETYTIRIKDLKTGKLLSDKLEKTFSDALGMVPPQIIWHNTLKGLFYVGLNDNHTPYQVSFHTLGESQQKDRLIYQEKDPKLAPAIRQSADKKFIFIESGDFNLTETSCLSLEGQLTSPQIVISRDKKTLPKVDHREGYFYISINDHDKNKFRLIRTPDAKLTADSWEEIVPVSSTSYLSNFALYQNHLVLTQKEEGLTHIRVKPFSELALAEEVVFPDAVCEVKVNFTRLDDPYLRLDYSSPLRPDTVYEYEFKTKELHQRKVTETDRSFNPNHYQIERLQAPSKDGTLIPMTLIYRKDKKLPEGNPVVIYGYGASAISVDFYFRPSIFSLLDRGFVYALVHARGGDELGFKWYEEGKMLNKRHTFEDVIGCSEYLIEKGYTHKKEIALFGGSAGGTLVAACVNERPDLYQAGIAFVPFVDVLNEMLDETLPLTLGYTSEIGNPKEEKVYHYMKSYSPYDNVKAQDYPHLYVTTGLKDIRVPYWGPLKWVAKLREMKTDKNLLLLDVQMDEGHAGPAGRTAYLNREMSRMYAFILSVFGMADKG